MPAYAQEVLNDAPLLYFRLNETSGTTALDSSGYGRNGVYFGTPEFSASSLLSGDVNNKAVAFSGNDYIDIAYQSWMNTPHATWEAIVSTTANGAIWDRDNDSERTFQFRIASNKLELILFSGGLIIVTSTTSVVPGDHVAATYDGANIKLYINGVLDKTVSYVANLSFGGPTSSITIGVNRSAGQNNFFNGIIDEAAYYGTALSATRIAAHSAARSVTAPGNPNYQNSGYSYSYENVGVKELITNPDGAGYTYELPTATTSSITTGTSPVSSSSSSNMAITGNSPVTAGSSSQIAPPPVDLSIFPPAVVYDELHQPWDVRSRRVYWNGGNLTLLHAMDGNDGYANIYFSVNVLIDGSSNDLAATYRYWSGPVWEDYVVGEYVAPGFYYFVTWSTSNLVTPTQVLSRLPLGMWWVDSSNEIHVPIEFSGTIDPIFPPPAPPVDFEGLSDPTSPPTLIKSSTSSGRLLPGTYYYSYAGWKGTEAQATAPSPTAYIELTTENTVTLTYPTIDQADGYLVYREDFIVENSVTPPAEPPVVIPTGAGAITARGNTGKTTAAEFGNRDMGMFSTLSGWNELQPTKTAIASGGEWADLNASVVDAHTDNYIILMRVLCGIEHTPTWVYSDPANPVPWVDASSDTLGTYPVRTGTPSFNPNAGNGVVQGNYPVPLPWNLGANGSTDALIKAAVDSSNLRVHYRSFLTLLNSWLTGPCPADSSHTRAEHVRIIPATLSTAYGSEMTTSDGNKVNGVSTYFKTAVSSNNSAIVGNNSTGTGKLQVAYRHAWKRALEDHLELMPSVDTSLAGGHLFGDGGKNALNLLEELGSTMGSRCVWIRTDFRQSYFTTFGGGPNSPTSPISFLLRAQTLGAAYGIQTAKDGTTTETIFDKGGPATTDVFAGMIEELLSRLPYLRFIETSVSLSRPASTTQNSGGFFGGQAYPTTAKVGSGPYAGSGWPGGNANAAQYLTGAAMSVQNRMQ